MENQVLSVIKSRSSIRAYRDTPLSAAEIGALKEAALCSPTARDAQTQRYLFITCKKTLAKIEQAVADTIIKSGDPVSIERLASRNNKVIYNAPLLVVIATDPKNSYGKVDAGIAVENLALAAKSLGLDSVILGMPSLAFEDEELKALLPQGLAFAVSIAVGHRAMDKSPHAYDESHVIDIK